MKQFGLKHEIETERSLFYSHYDFQGGIGKYHQWMAALVGGLLFLLAFSFNQGAWIYFYLLGMVKVIKDTAKSGTVSTSHGLKDVNTAPLVYYLVTALIVAVIMVEAGHNFPDLTFGLIENTASVIPFYG